MINLLSNTSGMLLPCDVEAGLALMVEAASGISLVRLTSLFYGPLRVSGKLDCAIDYNIILNIWLDRTGIFFVR